MEYRWIRSDMDIKAIVNSSSIIKVENSGVLEADFYRYSKDFNEAANIIMKQLITDASSRGDISQLDLWYFALVYLYRQSLEELIKANIFKLELDSTKRKNILGNVRHDLKQAFDELVSLSNIDMTNDNVKWLSDFLEDISKIDKESDMFRYPFNHKMQTLFNRQTHVYLPATYYNMNRAFDLLKGFYKNASFNNKKCEPHEVYEPKLIVEGGAYYFQSVVGYKFGEGSYFPYATSYLECGNFLKNVIMEQGKSNLFMPMCYLYRNAVELGLKKIIVESSSLDKEDALKAIRKKKHSFLGLWNKIASEVRNLAYDPTDPTVDYVDHYINNFHDFDTASDKFRYPCNKNLNVYFLDSTTLDIENVSNCFIELISFLDGVDCMLLYEKECKEEMAREYALDEAEMQSEYESEIAREYNSYFGK